MAHYSELTRDQKLASNSMYTAVLKAVCPDDPSGHLPNCGYSDEFPNCDCSAMGSRLHQAIVDEISK